MHEIMLISIGAVIMDRTTGNNDSPLYRVQLKFYIFGLSHRDGKAHIYAAIHAQTHTHKHICTHHLVILCCQLVGLS